ncbi:MAG TPA: efflux RND transporter permease subunit [Steroidobacteraceae bacterium]|jgi:multidrug efflux pump subunit AcrB|nr:efflux RND transporter permease subunit [Steroidobacteraceae bacterium]
MWIVRIALQRPYTFIVLAIFILLAGLLAIVRSPKDIFPSINIPVVASIWTYTGLQPRDMADEIALSIERGAQTTVNDIEHTESQSLNGVSVIKYFFQPNASEQLSFAQITGVSQTQLKNSPPGTTPPFILAYNASTVPIIQLALSSDTLTEQQLFDLGNNDIRTDLATVAGAAMPYPYGGKQRQIQVDLQPSELQARGLAPSDVTDAIGAQNLILPAGTQKIGDLEYFISLNASPRSVAQLNDLPIKAADGSVVYVRDVAHVRDGYPPQTNIVRLEGRRGVLMTVLKTGSTSTLSVIDGIKARLPGLRAQLPKDLKIEPIEDQSVFVRAAISGVVREAIIAAALTGLMILLFLGSWRSTLIISLSIPLSILASLAALSVIGGTINIMTLGGLALSVGILVDDATVTIENINWHLERGAEVEPAIMEGARQIALPALVSTLSICIVFVPMFALAGIGRYLFVPMAEAVVFAMLASYLLSRTFVPTLSKYWLHRPQAATRPWRITAWLQRFQRRFERGFERARGHYEALLQRTLAQGLRFALIFLAAMAATAILAFPLARYLPGLGEDFFPTVDTGQIKLHLRARTGLRIEETAALCDRVEAAIRRVIPTSQIDTLVDNIGLPYSGINLAYSTSAPVGPQDADIYISLKPHHDAVAGYIRTLRRVLPGEFPSTSFAFLPADIISQTLNFGLPSPLDVQIIGRDVSGNRAYAAQLLQRLHRVPGLVDLELQQPEDYPTLDVNVDRTKARLMGLTERDVASNMLVSLSGSFQTSPSFWTDPSSGTQYEVVAQTPQYRLDTPNALAVTPLSIGSGGGYGGGSGGAAGAAAQAQILANVASVQRAESPAVVSHYDAKPVLDIYGAAQDIDLGFIASQTRSIVAGTRNLLPRGSNVAIRGQVQTMQQSFRSLMLGLVVAVALVYLLIVVNFQSWLDPLIIISALPATLAGIVWMLFLSHTTVSVPALTGAIMSIGVATANSVLVVSFAREQMNAGDSAATAAVHAAVTRLRPVLMTALAMIIGMVPMAMGLGEGGEQNAPLGRAVIGGLIFATVATLFFVPSVFALIHGRFSRERGVVVRRNDEPT